MATAHNEGNITVIISIVGGKHLTFSRPALAMGLSSIVSSACSAHSA